MRKGDSWKQSWKMPFLRTLVMEQKWACLQGFLPEPWMQYSKTAQGSCVWAGSEGPGQFPVLLSLGLAATFGGFCVKCTLWAWLFPYLLTGLSIPSEHPLEGSEFLSVLGVRSLVLLENGTFLLWGWFSTELSLILVLATIITSSRSILVSFCFVLEWVWWLPSSRAVWKQSRPLSLWRSLPHS